jgi:hypothetical protein
MEMENKFLKLNQRQEPINQKYKGNEGMHGHKPMKTNEKKQ